MPVFSRAFDYQSNNYQIQNKDNIVNIKQEKDRSIIKRSRSKSKNKNIRTNKSGGSNSNNNIRGNNSSVEEKGFNYYSNLNNNKNFNEYNQPNYYEDEVLSEDDFEVSYLNQEKRPHSLNHNKKVKSAYFAKGEAKPKNNNNSLNDINNILKQNVNQDPKENDFHFNYNFNNENFCSDDKSNINKKDYLYDKLYKEAENLRIKKVILSNEIYSEKYGITFQPKINHNPKYTIESNFEERSYIYLKNKREKIDKLIQDKYEQDPFLAKKSRTLSKEEKEKNTKNIVDRLYRKQMEKIKEHKEKKIEEEKKQK